MLELLKANKIKKIKTRQFIFFEDTPEDNLTIEQSDNLIIIKNNDKTILTLDTTVTHEIRKNNKNTIAIYPLNITITFYELNLPNKCPFCFSDIKKERLFSKTSKKEYEYYECNECGKKDIHELKEN